MVEHEIEITTGEGSMTTFIVHPGAGGPHRVVVFLMDAPGKRALLHDMARTLAEHGYYVMLPNLYHRATPAFELDFARRESFARMTELMRAVGNKMAARDAAAMFAHADDDAAADARRVRCVGYCMSGPFAVWVAAEFPDRVRAAASFYGVRLVIDGPDSPHLRLGRDHRRGVHGVRRAVLGQPSRIRLQRPPIIRPGGRPTALDCAARPVRPQSAQRMRLRNFR